MKFLLSFRWVAMSHRTTYTVLVNAGDHNQIKLVSEGVLARLRARYQSLSEGERSVAAFIEQEPKTFVRLPIKAIAAQIGVSEATVVRCCQSLGYGGVRELKLALAVETVTPLQMIREEVLPSDSVLLIAHKVLHADLQALADTLAVIDGEVLEAVVDALLAAPRIEFYGVGSSISVVIDAHYRFLRIGIPTAVVTDPYMQVVSAAQLPAQAVAFAVSHSGRSIETGNALQAARRAGAVCVLLTSHANAPIAEHADLQLVTAGDTMASGEESVARRIAHLSLIEALYVAVALRRGDETEAATRRTRAALAGRTR
ncbi:MAG: hypothetical protein AVDCRST_MAG93-5315 [uncultured Chloroflexia bacterium]|uniref:Transcriptional regulator, RpiR family n=1 Tax=uncultured Chloroflexia bacterium TaxID=1672391 RepID=A0A6J4KQV6_9CHLR|nr:MAG: hypothetical protein AVDCRST_MAG93-5315 [uncultured Chloroflexia bacterium]